MPLGGLITLAILLSNILMLAMPPREVPSAPVQQDKRYRILWVFEWIGRIALLAIPFFYALPVLREASVDALAVMVLALGFYYSAWARYASKGHRFVLLYAPFLSIPLPMALAPVLYFAAAAVFLGSWPMAVALVPFAISHLYMSSLEWKRVKTRAGEGLFSQRQS